MKRGWMTWMWTLAVLGVAAATARADLAYFGPSPRQGAQIGAGAGIVAGILCFLPVFGGCLLAVKVVERKSHRVAFALAGAVFTVLAAGPWLWMMAGPETGIWFACAAGLILIAPLYGMFRALGNRAAWRPWLLMLASAILLAGGIASCASFGYAIQEKALEEHEKQRRRNVGLDVEYAIQEKALEKHGKQRRGNGTTNIKTPYQEDGIVGGEIIQ